MGTSNRTHSTSTRGCCEGRFVAGGGSPNDPQTQVGVLVGFLSFQFSSHPLEPSPPLPHARILIERSDSTFAATLAVLGSGRSLGLCRRRPAAGACRFPDARGAGGGWVGTSRTAAVRRAAGAVKGLTRRGGGSAGRACALPPSIVSTAARSAGERSPGPSGAVRLAGGAGGGWSRSATPRDRGFQSSAWLPHRREPFRGLKESGPSAPVVES